MITGKFAGMQPGDMDAARAAGAQGIVTIAGYRDKGSSE